MALHSTNSINRSQIVICTMYSSYVHALIYAQQILHLIRKILVLPNSVYHINVQQMSLCILNLFTVRSLIAQLQDDSSENMHWQPDHCIALVIDLKL